MTLVLKPLTLDNLPQFVLRKADELECLAGGMTGEIAVRRSILLSHNAFAHYWDDELLCLWGFRYIERPWSASMWLLSTSAVEQHPRAFARASKKVLEILQAEVYHIEVTVHVGYTQAIRWLEWLGFKRAEALNENFMTMKKDRD